MFKSLSEFSDWINEVEPTLSSTHLPVTDLNMQQVENLLASHQVCALRCLQPKVKTS